MFLFLCGVDVKKGRCESKICKREGKKIEKIYLDKQFITDVSNVWTFVHGPNPYTCHDFDKPAVFSPWKPIHAPYRPHLASTAHLCPIGCFCPYSLPLPHRLPMPPTCHLCPTGCLCPLCHLCPTGLPCPTHATSSCYRSICSFLSYTVQNSSWWE